MFSRILKASLFPLVSPSRLILPKILYKSPLFYSLPKYTFSSTPSQSHSQAQSIMKSFIQKETVTGDEILQTLSQLESSKLGITASNPDFKEFMVRLNDSVRGKFTAEQLEAIALKAYNLNIKDPIFWFSLDNTVKSGDSNVGLGSMLVLFSTFLQVKSYPQFIKYLAGMQGEFLEEIKRMVPELDFRSLIHASYIFASLNTPFPELTKRLKNELRNSLKNPSSADISINELGTTTAVLTAVLKDSESDKKELLDGLGKFLNSQDLNQYCIAESEDRITWQSIAYLLRTYSLPQYRNEELVKKLNEVLLKKSESDVIDFESASMILSLFSSQDTKGSAGKVIEKVLEMVHSQLASEGAVMFSEFDGRNVSAFLRAVILLGKKGIDREVVGELVEYFQGLILSNKISTKIAEEDYGVLKKLFEDAKEVGEVDQRIFDHIKRRLEYIEVQRKREIVEQGPMQ